jgi:hypothetical protein
VGSVVVVPACPAWQGAGAVSARGVDVGVGPFALEDADDGFCFAVRAGRVWLGSDVFEAVASPASRPIADAVSGCGLAKDAA